MESDFDCVLNKYCFASKIYYPAFDDLKEFLSDPSPHKRLVLLDYNDKDFIDQMILIEQSKQPVVLLLKDCYTVGEWAGILPIIKSIGVNFAISTVGDNGLVEWHE
jgi:hypothetical protein